ncbi:hypothetical protein [Saccharopolyspora spinosa]|uniref:hypothetical protein n=1 Tax=Saccharopolyspora spinosa TaxID=60894 RepID=UPI003749DFE6
MAEAEAAVHEMEIRRTKLVRARQYRREVATDARGRREAAQREAAEAEGRIREVGVLVERTYAWASAFASGRQDVGRESLGGLGVTAVAGADVGGGDDLAVRVDGDMACGAVETAGLGFVPVAGFGVDGGDDPVGRDRPGHASCVSRGWAKIGRAPSSQKWFIRHAGHIGFEF